MLDIGVKGLDPDAFEFADVRDQIQHATPLRIFAVAKALAQGITVDEIHDLSKIDKWFLNAIVPIVKTHLEIQRAGAALEEAPLAEAKRLGFSDQMLGHLTGKKRSEIRDQRKRFGIQPHLAQIDTMAAEFPAETNYLYSSYHARNTDVSSSWRKKILVLGSGAYRIGSRRGVRLVRVNAIRTASELGYETMMLNYNPETVSTDYDTCDKLVFDEISIETVLEIYDREQPYGIVVSMGGQVPNNLAMRLHQAGARILGTSAESIDMAEDRQKFSALLDKLGIDQPKWDHVVDAASAMDIVKKLGGFPVLVRPSYVLSGAAMRVAHEPNELQRILAAAKAISKSHPVVISKFETHAREIEIDAVADRGELVLSAISEHIEDAGVHSGDATLVLPPQTLYIATIRRVKQIAATLARAQHHRAVQHAVPGQEQPGAGDRVQPPRVAELPLRLKVTGQNYVAEAMRRMLGVRKPIENRGIELDYVAVKAPMFSFSRLVGADPMLGVEMASTGEVGCFGDDVHEALLHALLATGFRFPKKGVLLSLGPLQEKYWFADEARVITEHLGLPIYATPGTAEALRSLGIACTSLGKGPADGAGAVHAIEEGKVDLVINIPREYDQEGRPDGYWIRRRAVDAGIPLLTDLQLARAVVEALRHKRAGQLSTLAYDEYLSATTAPRSR